MSTMKNMRRETLILAAVVLIIGSISCLNDHVGANDDQPRLKAAVKQNATCILVFGDSSVDPGNNDRLDTLVKGNYKPYGTDFINGQPSGRFCNGRLATDFIAEAMGYTNLVKGFVDPSLTKNDMLHGVSFASAASGYDPFTANLSNVLSLTKQLEYLRHYKIHLRNLVGAKESENIVQDAIFVVSMGTNDFLQNYYVNPFRSKQYTVEQYQNYLISYMRAAIKETHSEGARRIAVVGVPPYGCMPLVRTFRDDVKCDVEMNSVASSFNSKIQKELKSLSGLFTASIFVDIYTIIMDVIQNPKRYDIMEPLKGCCGSGTYEYGTTCKGSSICEDRTKYVFWDAVHPTEKIYRLIADKAIQVFRGDFF